MTDNLARHLVRAAFRTTRELQELLPVVKAHLPESDYRDYAVAIAGAVHSVNEALLEKPLADKPGLRAEIEESLERYNRYL